MSKFILLSLFVLASCVASNTEPVESNGEVRRFTPKVSSQTDINRALAICNALNEKANLLNVLSNSGKEYVFDFTSKGCASSATPVTKTIPTSIVYGSSSYVFKSKTADNFGFSDVETNVQGVMSTICQWGGTLESPIQPYPGSSQALWWTANVSNDFCKPDANNFCIELEHGTRTEGEFFRIHTTEWIKFQINGANKGFFVERKLISEAGCQRGESFESRAVLK